MVIVIAFSCTSRSARDQQEGGLLDRDGKYTGFHAIPDATLDGGAEFADIDAVASVEIELFHPRGEPIHLDDSRQIRVLLSTFRRWARTDPFRIGFANARIAVKFITGGEAIYVVAGKAWEGPPDPSRADAGFSKGHLTSSWEDILASLNEAR